nr:beta-agarase [uncultured bacterium]
MKEILQIKEQQMINGSYLVNEEGKNVFICPGEGLDYCIFNRSQMPEVLPERYSYLSFFIEYKGEDSLCLQLSFYTKSTESDIRMIFGILPHTRVRIPFDLSILDSQTLFPERSKGRLKMTVFGKPVRLNEIEEIRLQTTKRQEDCQFIIEEIAFNNEKEEWVSSSVLIDELGQWIPKNWKDKKKDREECNEFLRALYKKAEQKSVVESELFDRYGGYKKITLEKNGWFHIDKKNGRYWLADPDGNAFFSMGIDCIRPGVETRTDPVRMWMGDILETMKQLPEYEECFEQGHFLPGAEFFNFGIANMIAAFGSREWKKAWYKIILYYMKKWKMNTIGNWSDPEFIEFADMPYVIPLDRYAKNGFPSTQNKVFRDFPDVFAEEYKINALEYASALEPVKNDRNLIGFFMRNEPAWAFVYDLILAEEMLASEVRFESKKVLIQRLKDNYVTIGRLNESWKTNYLEFDDLYQPILNASEFSEKAKEDLKEFSEEMIERYVGIPAQAIREVDKNHLNLGMRYAYITDDSLLSGAKYFDVFSINSYQETPLEAVNYAGEHLHMPVIVGEFHHGALDRGLTAHGIRGVKTQEDRGKAYRYYVEQTLQSPYFLGSHYFQLNDQSCLGRFDGENYQIGFLDVCMQEYEEMCSQVQLCHEKMYSIALFEEEPSNDKGEDVPPIHY